jgi:hypothetical protein
MWVSSPPSLSMSPSYSENPRPDFSTMKSFQVNKGLKVLSSEMDLAAIRFLLRGVEIFRKIRPFPIL